MKNAEQTVKWLEEQIMNFEFALSSSPVDNRLKLMREGALEFAKQAKLYITEDRWKK